MEKETKRRRVEMEENGPSRYIKLRIWGQDNSEFHVKVNRCTKLSRLMAAYASHKPIEGLGTYVYLIDGRRIHPFQTADDVGLKENDQIDAMIEQRGGSGLMLH